MTLDLPEVGDFFTAAEAATRPNFVAIAIELWASSLTTNGIINSIHNTRYVEVILAEPRASSSTRTASS